MGSPRSGNRAMSGAIACSYQGVGRRAIVGDRARISALIEIVGTVSKFGKHLRATRRIALGEQHGTGRRSASRGIFLSGSHSCASINCARKSRPALCAPRHSVPSRRCPIRTHPKAIRCDSRPHMQTTRFVHRAPTLVARIVQRRPWQFADAGELHDREASRARQRVEHCLPVTS